MSSPDSYDRTTPDVPILHSVFPLVNIPAPIAPQALSAPPANTRVVSASPVILAYVGSMVPTSACDSTNGGHIPVSISSKLQISSLHSFARTSNNNVPAASEYSVCNLPVN